MDKEWSITRPRIFDLLAPATNVLLAGCGGGYDVVSSLPIYFALRAQGKKVTLANLSFTSLKQTDTPTLCEGCHIITSSYQPKKVYEGRYFPELYLARWLKEKESTDINIYAFDRDIGAAPLSKIYRELATQLNLDAVVVVDGGTDSLMLGSEYNMGTPAEDHCSMVACNASQIPIKILACIGFGVDSFHGVSHGLFLENVATIEKANGFLGNFSVSQHSREGQLYMEGYAAIAANMQPSIVCASITDSMKGYFGNHHSTRRTGNSQLFLNSLMTLYWTFDLQIVVQNIPYADTLLTTPTMVAVDQLIMRHTGEVVQKGEIRKKLPLPM